MVITLVTVLSFVSSGTTLPQIATRYILAAHLTFMITLLKLLALKYEKKICVQGKCPILGISTNDIRSYCKVNQLWNPSSHAEHSKVILDFRLPHSAHS